MMEFLANLKQKPRHIRMRIFIIVMVLAFFIVVFLWIALVGNNIARLDNKEQKDDSIFSEKITLPNISDSLKASASAVFDGKDIQIK